MASDAKRGRPQAACAGMALAQWFGSTPKTPLYHALGRLALTKQSAVADEPLGLIGTLQHQQFISAMQHTHINLAAVTRENPISALHCPQIWFFAHNT